MPRCRCSLRLGFTLAHEVRDTCGCSNKPLPVICIVTAHGDPAVHKMCRDANVDCIFVKPVKKVHLQGVLDAHFENAGVARGMGMLSGLRGGAHMDSNQIADAKALSAFTAHHAHFTRSKGALGRSDINHFPLQAGALGNGA